MYVVRTGIWTLYRTRICAVLLFFCSQFHIEMPKAKEKIKSADRHDRGKSWTSEEEEYSLSFASRKKSKETRIRLIEYHLLKLTIGNMFFFLKPRISFQVIVEWKSSYIPSAVRGYMHGTGAAYVTLIASFVFKASARWSLFKYLSWRIVGNWRVWHARRVCSSSWGCV